MRPLPAVVVALLAASVAPGAVAEPLPYRGPHPIDLEGHWHEEDAVHVHDDLPVGTGPFAAVDGVLVFLGDPAAYGWDGAVWTYDGVHPLPARIGEYCGIAGEHRHPFAPEGSFRERDDGSWKYVGALRGGVPQHRPGRLEPGGGPVPPAASGGDAPIPYPYAPFCGVVTERVGDATTTFVSGYPGCWSGPAAVRRPRRAPSPRRVDRPRRVRRPARPAPRHHDTDARPARRDTDRERPRRSGVPATGRGR